EIMLNAANLLIVLGARVKGLADAEAAALIVLVLAAAEAVIGLALALALFRRRPVPDVDDVAELRGGWASSPGRGLSHCPAWCSPPRACRPAGSTPATPAWPGRQCC